jgi:hypothetical protein
MFVSLAALLGIQSSVQAAIATWTGASSTDTNWSDGNNWSGGTGSAGVPAAANSVVFNNTGTTTSSGVSNVVDSTGGNFLGTIASLQYANTANSQNTLIASGVTLYVTGTDSSGDTFVVGTENISSPAAMVTNSISGPGGTLIVSNTADNFMVSQSAAATGAKATLILTNLDNLLVDVSRIGVGVSGKYGWFNNDSQTYPNGVIYLARTNIITTSFSMVPGVTTSYTNWAGYIYVSGHEIEEAIEVGNGADNSASTTPSFIYLGQTNAFYIDSIGVGKSKSSAAGASLLFNPIFSSPAAYFRGTNGSASRVSFWAIGDNATGGSTSSGAFGTNDFSGGTVDILADQMFLGIDKLTQTGSSARGALFFTGGIINVNGLTLGAQESTTAANIGTAVGVMTLNGAGATLQVNGNLELGHTTVNSPGATNSFGLLSVTNGTVFANNIIVGAVSTNNTINLVNATLIVTNTLATNSSGLANFTITNSVLGLTVPANASLLGLVQTLNAGSGTNSIQLASVPVFSAASYPRQFPLIKYTTMTGTFDFGLTNLPASAPGAYLSNNVTSSPKSIDLVIPVSPAPVITVPPQPFSGSPGATVTLTVTNTGNTPLAYQWYYTNGFATNLLSGSTGPGGSSAMSGSASNVLTLAGAQTGDSGGYFVILTNLYGSATSTVVQVTIAASAVPPSVTGPSSQTVIAGNNTTISDSPSGSPVPVLQWQFNGTNLTDGVQNDGSGIIGSMTAALTITNVQYPGDQGTYSLVASNSAGLATNNTYLTVIVTPTISVQPISQVVTNTQSVTFSVTASGVPAPGYQWYVGATPIANANSSVYTIASAQPSNIGVYSVLVTNSAGSLASSNVTLTVNSTMAATALSPTNGATGICYDTPLYISFSQAPVLNNIGKIKIYNVTNSSTPVDTLDLSLGSPQSRTIGGVAINAYPVIITGNTAAIYPHSGVMTSNQTYYVTIDDGVFEDGVGAYFAGIAATNTWQFATKVGGPANPTNLVVAADGSGDFATVQGAADFIPNGNANRVIVNIRNGTYTEIVRLNSKNSVTFRGQSRHQTFVTYPNWNGINGSSSTRPMFGVLGANDVAIENITLTNSTPNASGNNQAETLYVNSCKRFILYNADVDSYQDTLLVNASGDQAYVQDSHIQGNTDFMWGQGTLYATNAEILFMPFQSAQDYMTQARTPQGTNGFAFVNCRLIGANSGVTNCYLGRDASGSGYPYGQVALVTCTIDTNVVVPVGWALGSGSVQGSGANGTSNLRFWEYQSVYTNGDLVDTSQRASWSEQIDGNTATNLVENVTNWFGGWQPQLAPNILTNPISQSVPGGQSVTFSVSATGISAPAYQWLMNGTNLIGQTSATLTISDPNVNDDGTYSVIVSNAAGSVTSSPATLSVGNTAPVFTPVPDQTIGVGVTLTVTNIVTDPDVPPQILTFALLSAPASATLGSGTGIFSWRAPVASAGTTNLVELTVTDNGTPNLSATQTFNVIVNPVAQPTATLFNYANGQFSLTVNGDNGPDYIVQTSTNLTVWQNLFTNSSPAVPFTFTDSNAAAVPVQFYRIMLGP